MPGRGWAPGHSMDSQGLGLWGRTRQDSQAEGILWRSVAEPSKAEGLRIRTCRWGYLLSRRVQVPHHVELGLETMSILAFGA